MNAQTGIGGSYSPSMGRDHTGTAEGALSKASSAFALAAIVTVLFNTGLAWVKDAYDPLNTWMAHLTGHHWITHGLFDIALFVILGVVFMNVGAGARTKADHLVVGLVAAAVVSGLGLAAWFLVT
jgi:hypothetical protein